MTMTKYLCECGATHDVPVTTRKRSSTPLFFCPSCASPSYDLCRGCGFQAPAGTHKAAAGDTPYCMGCGKSEGLMAGKYQADVIAIGRCIVGGLITMFAFMKVMDVYQVPIQRWQIMVATKYIAPGGIWGAYILWGFICFYLWMLLGKHTVKFVHVLLCGHAKLSQPARLLELWVQAPFATVDPEEEYGVIHVARSLRRRMRMVRRYLKCCLKMRNPIARD